MMTIDEMKDCKGGELLLSPEEFKLLEVYLKKEGFHQNHYPSEPLEPKGILWNGIHFKK